MPKKYIAKDNDHISSVSIDHGLWTHAVLVAANKDKLSAKKRADLNVLFKGDAVVPTGDELTVPTNDEKPEPAKIDQYNPFTLDISELWLRIRLLNNDYSPLKDAKWVLTIPDVAKPIEGKTGADGHIETKIPDYFKKRNSAYAREATLTVTLPAEQSDGKKDKEKDDDAVVHGDEACRGDVSVTWKLSIGKLNPVAEKAAPDDRCVSGCQQRLNNLNLNTGPIDGIVGPNTTEAIKAFKKIVRVGSAKGKEGQPNYWMQDWMKRIHDSDKMPTLPKETDPEMPPMPSE